MPLYEYRCTSCGYTFEKIQSFSAEPERVCPKCQGALIRPVTAPALRFEGAGWYVNDYAGKGGAKAGESSAASEPGTAKDAKPGGDSTKDSKPAAGDGAASAAPAAPASTPAGTSAPSTN